MVTVVDRSESNNQSSLTQADLWYWLADHGLSKNEMDRKSTKFLADLYKQKKF